jgi:hypothetical protein
MSRPPNKTKEVIVDSITIFQTAGEQQFGPAANTQIAIALPAPVQHRPQFCGDHIPFKGTSKELRAIALRNSAVNLISRFGRPLPSVNPNRTICSAIAVPFGRDDSILISLSLADSQIMEIVEANPAVFPHFMQYGLDIWADRKVFNFEWNDHGTIDIVNFTRGPWESLLIALAPETL